jgi:hypothetical protein
LTWGAADHEADPVEPSPVDVVYVVPEGQRLGMGLGPGGEGVLVRFDAGNYGDPCGRQAD